MPGETIVVVVFILVFGCAAFLFGILYLLGRMLYASGRWMLRCAGLENREPLECAENTMVVTRVCPRTECKKLESRPDARFCGRCGMSLVRSSAEEAR